MHQNWLSLNVLMVSYWMIPFPWINSKYAWFNTVLFLFSVLNYFWPKKCLDISKNLISINPDSNNKQKQNAWWKFIVSNSNRAKSTCQMTDAKFSSTASTFLMKTSIEWWNKLIMRSSDLTPVVNIDCPKWSTIM